MKRSRRRIETVRVGNAAVKIYGEDLPPHPYHGRQPVWYNAETNVLGLELEPGCAEWVVFNPEGWPLKVHSLETNVTLVYQISDKPCRQ